VGRNHTVKRITLWEKRYFVEGNISTDLFNFTGKLTKPTSLNYSGLATLVIATNPGGNLGALVTQSTRMCGTPGHWAVGC